MPARAAANALRLYAHAMIHTAAAWDVLGAAGLLPAWWPPVSYVLAGAAIAAGCTAVLLAILPRNPAVLPSEDSAERASRTTAAPGSAARRSAGGQLLALGILLAAWLLRGHAEIPPDLPLVAAEVLAAALYALFARRRSS